MSEDERFLTKRCSCVFQENAQANTQVALDWENKILKPAADNLKRFILLADDQKGQVHRDFKEHVSNCSGVV